MVNKRRPRKFRPPYRRYGPGSSPAHQHNPQNLAGGPIAEVAPTLIDSAVADEVEDEMDELSGPMSSVSLNKRRASIDASEKQFLAALCWEKQVEAGEAAHEDIIRESEQLEKQLEALNATRRRRHTVEGVNEYSSRKKGLLKKPHKQTSVFFSDSSEDEEVFDELGNPIEQPHESDSSSDSIDMAELRLIEKKYLEMKRKRELERKHQEWLKEVQAQRDKKMAPFLPPEVMAVVFSYLSFPESLNALYVCKTWYSVGVEELYRDPRLNVYNYNTFVNTISHSDILGSMVKVLDLRNIIQSGKNSYTARLLRRCSASLQVFIAPQTSFGYAPLVSLKNCNEIRTLDLSLVSETVDLRALFNAIKNATKLERLDFPRSSVFCQKYEDAWPQNLWTLGLAGGISNDFMMDTRFPGTITHLSFSHCPFVNSESVRSVAGRLGQHLVSFTAYYPLPALLPNALDTILKLCPTLRTLNVSVDYISRYIFADPNLPSDERGNPMPHPLKYLHIDSSGGLGQGRKLDPDDISLAMLEHKIPNLSHVRVSRKLGWDPNADDMCELIEILEERNGGAWMV